MSDTFDFLKDQSQSSQKEQNNFEVGELFEQIDEIILSYGMLVQQVDSLTRQNVVLANKIILLESQMAFLLAKDEEYMAEAERILAQGENNGETSVSPSLPPQA